MLDSGVAESVLHAIEAAGRLCWIAPRDIPSGEDWSGCIPSAIDACKAVVLIFSSRANTSEEVRREIHLARAARRPVIPFRIEQFNPEGLFVVLA